MVSFRRLKVFVANIYFEQPTNSVRKISLISLDFRHFIFGAYFCLGFSSLNVSVKMSQRWNLGASQLAVKLGESDDVENEGICIPLTVGDGIRLCNKCLNSVGKA